MSQLADESTIERLFREAKEAEEGAEYYFDADCDTKAATWYYAAQRQYVWAMAYTLGMILGISESEMREQMIKAEEEYFATCEEW